MNSFKKVDDIIRRNKIEDDKEEIKDKNRKETFVDDGRSIADMNIEGFSWYTPKKYSTERQNLSDLKLTKKEKLAMILGALQAILPVAFMMFALFFGLFLLMAFWLN